MLIIAVVAETNSFVKLLFDVLSSGEYDAEVKAKRAAAKSAAQATQDLAIIPVTVALTSISASNVSSHGDVDMRTNRPEAVVQPLLTDDKDYRHMDVYRPAIDVHHHGDPQHRRDWKRKSPQRTVR